MALGRLLEYLGSIARGWQRQRLGHGTTHQDISEIVGVRYTTMFGDPGREFLQSFLASL